MANIYKVPVFYPTWEEFKDFNGYLASLETLGAHHSGLCKIVPPQEWKPRTVSFASLSKKTIAAPQLQKVTGIDGLYEYIRAEKPSMTVRQFRRLSSTDKFKPPDCDDWAELEERFWETVPTSESVYGADINGTVMDSDLNEWNIAHLGSILDGGLKDSGVSIQGVNTPYLYFGLWRAFFCWHVEDMDLYSINYIHMGRPKQWYCIPPAFARKFERFVREYFKGEFLKCPSFMRHKLCLISPKVLERAGIPVNKMIHMAGEIMITFPYGYHSGFNTGFNLAESTNFALPRWVDAAMCLNLCECRPQSVKFDVDIFVKRFHPDRYDAWLRGKDHAPHPLDEYDSEEWRKIKDSCPLLTEENSQYRPESHLESLDEKLNHDVIDENDLENTESQKKNSSLKRAGQKRKATTIRKLHDNDFTFIRKKVRTLQNKWASSTDVPDFIQNEVVKKVWYTQPEDFEAEKQYNQLICSYKPHCSVCTIIWSPQNFSRVISGRGGEPDQLPARSEPQIPEPAYARHYPVGKLTLPPVESHLLRCSRCRLVVHARCYGLSDMDNVSKSDVSASRPDPVLNGGSSCDSEDSAFYSFSSNRTSESDTTSHHQNHDSRPFSDWLCDPCRENSRLRSCCLCPVRGGALKRLESNGPWVHLVCLLASFDIVFSNIPKRLASLPRLRSLNWKITPCYCCQLFTPPLSSLNTDIRDIDRFQQIYHRPIARCVFTRCRTQVHVTCAQLNGMLIEAGNHPWYFYITCPLHYKLYKAKSLTECSDLKEGDAVYAKCTQLNRFIPGCVKSLHRPRQYTVRFDDGTFSKNVVEDMFRDYDKNTGCPELGSKVTIEWTDKKIYTVTINAVEGEKWQIELDNKNIVKYPRHMIYKTDESCIPSFVLKHVRDYFETFKSIGTETSDLGENGTLAETQTV